jgi:hypothetical protein
MSQAAFLTIMGSALNYAAQQKRLIVRPDLVRLLPPPHTVFLALVSDIPLLGEKLASNLVALYDTIDRARVLVEQLADDVHDEEAIKVRIPEIAMAVRKGAEIASTVVVDLKAIAPRSLLANSRYMPVLLSRLDAVRRGEAPNIDPAYA